MHAGVELLHVSKMWPMCIIVGYAWLDSFKTNDVHMFNFFMHLIYQMSM